MRYFFSDPTRHRLNPPASQIESIFILWCCLSSLFSKTVGSNLVIPKDSESSSVKLKICRRDFEIFLTFLFNHILNIGRHILNTRCPKILKSQRLRHVRSRGSAPNMCSAANVSYTSILNRDVTFWIENVTFWIENDKMWYFRFKMWRFRFKTWRLDSKY